MIFRSGWWEARGLLIREHLVVPLVLLRNSLLFHAFLLSLIFTLNGPFLREVHFVNLGLLLLLLVSFPRHSYFL
jgi:hypothetical protein